MAKKFLEHLQEHKEQLPVHLYYLSTPEFFKRKATDSKSQFHNTKHFAVRISTKPASCTTIQDNGSK